MRRLTPDRDDGENDPRSPVRQVLDEDKCHEGADHNEIGLLEPQRTFPVDADHSNHSEVPHQQSNGDIVHRNVVRQQHLAEIQNNV